MTPADAAPDLSADESARNFWERSRIGWHAVYVGLLVVLAVASAVEPDLTSPERVRSLLLIAALGGWYALLGVRVLGGVRPGLGLVYLAGAWSLWLALVSTHPTGYLLLIVLLPQVWAVTATATAAISVTVVAVLGIAALQAAAGGWTASAVADAATFGAINGAISCLLGLWVTGIIRESDRRAELIAELERTRTELAAAEHQRGVLTERERLAGEIHDTLAQSFTSILMLAQSAESVLDSDPAVTRARLAMVERSARDGLAQARSLVAARGPADLETATLADAVHRVVRGVGEELGLSAEVRVEGDTRALPADSEVVVLRATQEAMANIRKHAAARSVRVSLRYLLDAAVLEVSDDGPGFDRAAEELFARFVRGRAVTAAGSGIGLAVVAELVRAHGGTYEAGSSPLGGALVRLHLPAQVSSVASRSATTADTAAGCSPRG